MNYNLNFGNKGEKNYDNCLNDLPKDQYACPKCAKVPEIIGVDYENDYSIKLKCEDHGNMIKPIIEYFKEESKYTFIMKINSYIYNFNFFYSK